MFRNYIKIAWRNLTKNKSYSSINIGGLAIGIAACLLILHYVNFELSYENFHDKKDRIYRVQQNRYNNGKMSTQWAAGAFAVGNTFKEHIPEIEDYVKVIETRDIVVKTKNELLKIEEVFFASKSFFTLFSYPLLHGDPATVLNEPNTAAISESIALKIFGIVNVVGEYLPISGGRTYKITGVFKDMPVNSQLQPNFLASYSTFVSMNTTEDSNPEMWWNSDGCITYVILQEGVTPTNVEAKFISIVEENNGDHLRQYNSAVTYNLQPLTNIHLGENYMMEPSPNNDGKTIYLLLGIAFFILIIAWINYINLATARAINRAKEVGIRKAIGSQRKQLIMQFFFESALFNGIAIVLALLLIVIVLPAFNTLSGQQISYALFSQNRFWIGLSSLFIVGVFLSGAYPAFVLSSFKPIDVLKGNMIGTKQGGLLRKSLVVFQFAASLFLLVGTLTVYKQIQFMRNQSLGIDIEQTLVIAPPIVTDSTFTNKMSSLKAELLNYSPIKGIAASTSIPGSEVGWNAGGIKLTTQEDTEGKQYRIIGVDYDYLDLFDLKLIAGRAFSEEFGADPSSVIFNKIGIEQLGFTSSEEAIGKEIDFWGEQYTIVGVTDNFHQESLQASYDPMILRLFPSVRGYISIKTSTNELAQTINEVATKWDAFFPGNTFEYFILDDHYNKQYNADQRFGKVFGLFSILAILVACLGLFGLASFTALQRKKEIGIRKVLGASILSILKLLYKEFGVLLGVAFILAIPIAWLTTTSWLEEYAFRINLHWSFFLLPFLAIATVAFITVSFQTIKASLANPVKSLRTE
ncbi:MAG: ABC transporter permease [Cellulophaga sp.]